MILHPCLRVVDIRPAVAWQALGLNGLLRHGVLLLLLLLLLFSLLLLFLLLLSWDFEFLRVANEGLIHKFG